MNYLTKVIEAIKSYPVQAEIFVDINATFDVNAGDGVALGI